ncbi:hypothetical protein [Fusobacterium sp. PH5-44]|uniref:hypothetical protein n=1 Tax=unclassified Fusobacterium TaxID=2648384 RepID=UPI003D1E6F5E
MFKGFELWKFVSVQENIVFFMSVFTGILLFYLIIKKMKKSRNDDVALDKVTKKLIGTKKEPHYFVKKYAINSDDVLQGIFVDEYGIVLLKAIGFGIYINGSYISKKWKLSDNAKVIEIDNPLLLMGGVRGELENKLSEEKLNNVPIDTLVVFTDNFKKPEINLGSDAQTIIYDDLKKWVKKRKSTKKMENSVKNVAEILEKIKKVD